MPTEPITAEQLRADVVAVLDRYGIDLDDFVATDIDEIDEPELRDLWLMTRGALLATR